MIDTPEPTLPADLIMRAAKYPSLHPLQDRKKGEIKQLLDAMEKGWQYITFLSRTLRLDDQGKVWTETRTGEKHIGDCPKPYPKNLACTIEHDLTVIIQGTKDITLKSDHHFIREMRDILLRLAGSKNKREILWGFRVNNLTVLDDIRHNRNIAQHESRAQKMYNELIQKLKLSPREQALIGILSWEWKVLPEVNFSSYKYSCRMWILIHCVIDKIDYTRA